MVGIGRRPRVSCRARAASGSHRHVARCRWILELPIDHPTPAVGDRVDVVRLRPSGNRQPRLSSPDAGHSSFSAQRRSGTSATRRLGCEKPSPEPTSSTPRTPVVPPSCSTPSASSRPCVPTSPATRRQRSSELAGRLRRRRHGRSAHRRRHPVDLRSRVECGPCCRRGGRRRHRCSRPFRGDGGAGRLGSAERTLCLRGLPAPQGRRALHQAGSARHRGRVPWSCSPARARWRATLRDLADCFGRRPERRGGTRTHQASRGSVARDAGRGGACGGARPSHRAASSPWSSRARSNTEPEPDDLLEAVADLESAGISRSEAVRESRRPPWGVAA